MPAWTTEAELKLLLTIITQTGATLPDWESVSAAVGGGYSKEGCRQKFQQIKRSIAGGSTDSPKTPKKPKNTTVARATPTSGRKRKQAEVHDEDEDDEEAPSTKSPKAKKNKGETEKHRNIKRELDVDDDETVDGTVDYTIELNEEE